MRKIHLLGFSIQRLLGKSLEISSNFSIGPLFSQFDWWVPMTWGLNPYFIWGSNIFFLAVRDWSLITGRGGLQNGKIAGPKLFAPPLQDRVKLFAPPLLKSGNFSRPPPTMWLKLKATA